MKTAIILASLTSLATSFALAGTDNFDTAKPGKPPPGWTVGVTGKGEPKWTVEKDESAPSKPQVLKQAGEADFAVALKDGTNLQDGVIEVKFKTLSGQQDQVGGLIWRASDTNNYYVVRAQALRGNLGFYKAVDGKRTTLKKADGKNAVFPATVQRGQWHTLRVEFTGNRCKATLDGKDGFEVEDDTFSSAGQVGVWTKADSVTVFDDFVFGSK
jgi:hypothetical protein